MLWKTIRHSSSKESGKLMQRILYRLPDGELTFNHATYSNAWQKLAEPIEKATGTKLTGFDPALSFATDRKSTRLNSSHLGISYAVFCLKKKQQNKKKHITYTHPPPLAPGTNSTYQT